jgi:TonB family protein
MVRVSAQENLDEPVPGRQNGNSVGRAGVEGYRRFDRIKCCYPIGGVDILNGSRQTPHNNGRPLKFKVPRMPQNPMLQPDSYGPSSWGEKSSGEKLSDGKLEEKKNSRPVGEVVSSQDPRDVTEVARTLAAYGGGAASYDLALDLVLHQVVEEARFATGATGAAIALARAGEMVCRATSGRDAPDLGVRVETTSGLSGACLQTGTIQQCGDTETDPRVNAEACRRLGVRSILVLPLGDGPQPFGVLEVFSSLVDAFQDRDIRELQILARRVVANKRGAEDGAAVLPDDVLVGVASPAAAEKSSAPAIDTKASEELKASAEPERASEFAAEVPAGAGYARRNDIWTPVLGILVIVTAVLLGLELGWRGAIRHGLNEGVNASQAKANRRGDSSLEQTAAAPSGDLTSPVQSGLAVHPGTSGEGASIPKSVEPANGELVVTQNGKVIYRLPAAAPADIARKAAAASGSKELQEGEVSDSRLIHRVEPQYPPEASAQKIQGMVTLDLQIGSEGAVHNIAVVDGNPVLAQAAVEAVRQWRYQPYVVDGRPAEMQTRVRIRFRLPPS